MLIPKCDSTNALCNNIIVSDPEIITEKSILSDRVNNQQLLMTANSLTPERTYSCSPQQSPRPESQAGKTNCLVLYGDVNSPLLLPQETPEALYDRLTQKDYYLRIPLDDLPTFNEAIPLLETWDQEMLNRLFTLLTVRLTHSGNYSLLLSPDNILAATRLFKKVSQEVSAKFFCTLVSCGSSFAKPGDSWAKIMPLFSQLDPKAAVCIFKSLAAQGIWDYPWFHSGVFTAGIPFLESLKSDPELLVEFFSILNEGGKVVLHDPMILTAATRFLLELPSDLLIKVLSIPNAWGRVPLDDFEVFRSAIYLLETMKSTNRWKDVVDILSILNKNNGPCLFSSSVLHVAIPYIMTFGKSEALDVFSIRDGDGAPLLMFSHLIPELLPYFNELPLDWLTEIFSFSDADGLVPLNDADVFEAMVPLFEESDEIFVDLLAVRNAEGAIALTNPDVLHVAIGYLKTRTAEVVVKAMSITDSNGRTLLNYLNELEELVIFLQAQEGVVLEQILSIADEEGWVPLDYAHVFEAMIPSLAALKSGGKWAVVLKILSIINQNRTACLFNRLVFEAAVPFLLTLDLDELIEVFSILDQDGEPILLYPRMWEVMIPYFETLKREVLGKFLNLVYEYKSLENYPTVWESNIKPFIEKLDWTKEEKFKLPFWRDFQYKSIMLRQRTG